MAYKTPTLEIYTNGTLFYPDGKFTPDNCLDIDAGGNTQWFEWLNDNKSFRVECMLSNFTVRKETRKDSSNCYWSAFKKIDKKLHKIYVGKSEDITPERLYEIADIFLGRKKRN